MCSIQLLGAPELMSSSKDTAIMSCMMQSTKDTIRDVRTHAAQLEEAVEFNSESVRKMDKTEHRFPNSFSCNGTAIDQALVTAPTTRNEEEHEQFLIGVEVVEDVGYG